MFTELVDFTIELVRLSCLRWHRQTINTASLYGAIATPRDFDNRAVARLPIDMAVRTIDIFLRFNYYRFVEINYSSNI